MNNRHLVTNSELAYSETAGRVDLLNRETEIELGTKINDAYANLLCVSLGTDAGPKVLEDLEVFLRTVDLNKAELQFCYQGIQCHSKPSEIPVYQEVGDYYRSTPWNLDSLADTPDPFISPHAESLAKIIAGKNKNHLQDWLITPTSEFLRTLVPSQFTVYEKLASRYISDVDDHKNHFTLANTRLVVRIAKKYVGKGLDKLTLINEGNLGLMHAVGMFDYTYGTKFSSFGSHHIRERMIKAISTQARAIKKGTTTYEINKDIERATKDLLPRLGRSPSIDELAKELGRKSSTIYAAFVDGRPMLHLDAPMSGTERSLIEFVKDPQEGNPLKYLEVEERNRDIGSVLSDLTDREQRILRMRFGLGLERSYTLKEVGKKFDLTRERIRQIEAKALERLRYPSRAEKLKPHYLE